MRTPALAAALAALALSAAPAPADEVAYTVGDQQLTGYFAAAENSRGLVLIVHDWTG